MIPLAICAIIGDKMTEPKPDYRVEIFKADETVVCKGDHVITKQNQPIKNSTPAQRRAAQATIEAMANEVDSARILIERDMFGRWLIRANIAGTERMAYAITLDDAFIKLLHTIAGTKPPPF